MPSSLYTPRGKRARKRDAWAVIDRHLKASYSRILQDPLPRELTDLLAQLVALESRNQAVSEPSVAAGQLEIK